MRLDASDSQLSRDDADILRAAARRSILQQYNLLLRNLTLAQLDEREQKYRAAGLQTLADLARAEADRRRGYPNPASELHP